MALLCPVTLPTSADGGCVGKFLSTDVVHLVVSDGYDLVFEQLHPETNQPALRLPLAVDGQIAGLHRVSRSGCDKASTGIVNALDALCVEVRVFGGGGNATSSFEQRLILKLYDPATREFNTASMFSCDGGSMHPVSSSWSCLSACDSSGPLHGTIAFASSGSGDITLLDPFNTKTATVCGYEKTTPISGSIMIQWLSDDLLVFSMKRSDQASYVMHLLRVQRKGKNAKHGFQHTTIDLVTLPAGLKLTGIGAMMNDKVGTVYAVLSDDSVNTYSLKGNKLELIDEKRLDLPKLHAQLTGFPEKHRQRTWVILPQESCKSLTFVSSDAIAFRVAEDGSFNLSRVEGFPPASELSHLGLGVFKVRTDRHSAVQMVKLHFSSSATSSSRIGFHRLKPKTYEFNSAKLLKHDYTTAFGSSFWFSFKGMMSNYLCFNEKTISSTFAPFQTYPFTEPVRRVWCIEERLIVSTACETQTYELKGNKLIRVPSEFDEDSSTFAAALGVQVLKGVVKFHGASSVSLAINSVVSAATDGARAVVASPDAVVLIEDGEISWETPFDDVVVAVDVSGSSVAVCTASELNILDLASRKWTTQKLPNFSTSVAISGTGETFVGDTEGGVFSWPNQQYLKVASNPVKSLSCHDDGVIVLAGPNGSVYIDKDSRCCRLKVGDASEVAFKDNSFTGVVLTDGILRCATLDEASSRIPLLIESSELLHSHPEDLHVSGDALYSFDNENLKDRKFQIANFSNLKSVKSVDIPDHEEENLTDFQIFTLGEKKFLEVARREPKSSTDNSEDESDDDGDDDEDESDADRDDRFYAHVVARVYEFQADTNKLIVLDQKSFRVPGDPYEEIVVKFYTPHDFILFTHSSSAVSGHVSGSGTLKTGESVSCFEYLYDDHWISTDDGGVVVVTFTGDVARITQQGLLKTDPLLDCFRYFPKKLENGSTSGKNFSDAIFDVFKIRKQHRTLENLQLVTSSREKTGGPFSSLNVLEMEDAQVKRVARVYLHDQSLSLTAVNNSMIPSLQSDSQQDGCKYLDVLLPDVVVGTSRGGVYFLSIIKDSALVAALTKVQNLLRENIQLVDSDIIGHSDNDGIDGALLLTALNIPEAWALFEEAGLDPIDLKHTLEAIVN